MAITACRECQKEISEEAETCPHCGKPTKTKDPLFRGIIVAVTLSVVGYFTFQAVSCVESVGDAASEYRSDIDRIDEARDQREAERQAAQTASSGNVAASAQSAPDHMPLEDLKKMAMPITASKLYAAYDANEVSADNIYRNKVLAVSGMVADISKDFTDGIIVQVSDDGINSAWGWVAKGEEDKASKLKKLDYVILICTGDGKRIGSPMLKDCIITKDHGKKHHGKTNAIDQAANETDGTVLTDQEPATN